MTVVARFLRNRAAAVSLAILVLLCLAALFAPYLASQPQDFIDVAQRYVPPNAAHWMGTDNLGRDVMSLLIWGSRVSLSIGFVATAMAMVIGTIVGAVAGFYGGTWADIILMRVAETVEIIPVYFLLVTIVAMIRPGIFNIVLVIGLTSWSGVAGIVRGQFLSLREREFTEASRALGARDVQVIFRHILPNAAGPIVVAATMRIGGAILTESGLSFLGLGTQSPDTSWGQMLSMGRQYLHQAPWMAIWPGIPILVTVLAFNFVGDGVRDALDPRGRASVAVHLREPTGRG